MGLVGIDHVQLAMPAGGEDEARWFYRDLLGLVESQKPEPLRDRGGCWFEGPGVFVHLGVQMPFTPAVKAHPAFLVRELDELATRLAAAGFRIGPDDTVPGVRRFFANDPFGNRIEFIQLGQGFSQR